MYKDIDVIYAFCTDSANHSKRSYQKLVERSIDERDFAGNMERSAEQDEMDSTRNEVWK